MLCSCLDCTRDSTVKFRRMYCIGRLSVTQFQQPFWKPRQSSVLKSSAQTETRLRAPQQDDPPLPEMSERAIAAEDERVYSRRYHLYKAEALINLLFGALVWMIGLKMILQFLNADPSKLIVKMVYALTTPFLLPFIGVAPGFPFGPFLIDVSG